MDFEIRIDDLRGPEIAALLAEHLESAAKVSPPTSRHALNLDRLRQPDIRFWSVWQGQELAGCGALKNWMPGTGKSNRCGPPQLISGKESRRRSCNTSSPKRSGAVTAD